MKKITSLLALVAVSCAFAIVSPCAHAQTAATTTTTSTTTSAGTISEFSPSTIVIKSESAPDPIRYTYTKSTTYVDENGQPVSMEIVKSGVPVTVYYTKDGDNMVATKVIVRKVVSGGSGDGTTVDKKTTTTTTTTDK